ncbi:ABC transporter ATP-binding protein [Lysobacter enzymogenes]|nr:ABC transporter ATP-binding protein [Lysobacter enzymogenes]
MRSSRSGSWRWAGEPGHREARRGDAAVTSADSPAVPTARADGEAGDDVIIRIRGLVNHFGEQVVHDGLDLDVKRGEIIGVVGGSGTGKSVMMRSILGLRKPNAGQIEVLGIDARNPDPQLRREIERNTGVLFQDGALFSSLTVGENVQVPLKEYHSELPDSLRYELALLKVKLSGLPADAIDKLPSQLSGGMRKRAGLARALALDPPLLFLDEPTAGLDPIGAAAFDRLIRTLQQALGLTVFLITHDLDTLYAICDRIAVLADKKVIACAPIQEVEKLDHPWVQEYFHGPRARAAQVARDKNEHGRDAHASRTHDGAGKRDPAHGADEDAAAR